MRLFLLLLALLVAAPALAAPPTTPGNGWNGCSPSATAWLDIASSTPSVGSSGVACYEFDETLLNGSTADTSFRVTTNTASVCSVSNVNADGAGSMTWRLLSCPTGFTPSLSVCEDVVATFSADDCQAVTRGNYFIDVTADVTGTSEDAVISIRGY